MKHVAKYKFQEKLSVENSAQENKVILNSINKAEILGLDKKTIEHFIITQINIGKSIQYRYNTEWTYMPETTIQLYNLKYIRFKLNQLTNDTIQFIYKELKKNGEIKSHICLYINKIFLHNFKYSDKKMICSSLKQISLKR